jgi:serine/threonine protein phosphatase PrpC
MTANSYWVIDGASSLNKVNYIDDKGDVVWVANWWSRYLKEKIDSLQKTLQQILVEGINELNLEIADKVDVQSLSKLDRASCTIGLVRINAEKVECFVLGDVEILVLEASGKLNVLTDASIEGMDQQVMEMMASNPNRENEIEFNAYTAQELALLRKNRLTMNTKEGYAILEHDPTAIARGLYKEYALKNVKDILMGSDGFTIVYNKYHQINREDMIAVSKKEGIRNVVDMLRKIEKNDQRMTQYKRLRCHDDATAILLEGINEENESRVIV